MSLLSTNTTAVYHLGVEEGPGPLPSFPPDVGHSIQDFLEAHPEHMPRLREAVAQAGYDNGRSCLAEEVVKIQWEALQDSKADERRARAGALAMALHPRLGASSVVSKLPRELLKIILDHAELKEYTFLESIELCSRDSVALRGGLIPGDPLLCAVKCKYADATEAKYEEPLPEGVDAMVDAGTFELEPGEVIVRLRGVVLPIPSVLYKIQFFTSRNRASPGFMHRVPADLNAGDGLLMGFTEFRFDFSAPAGQHLAGLHFIVTRGLDDAHGFHFSRILPLWHKGPKMMIDDCSRVVPAEEIRYRHTQVENSLTASLGHVTIADSWYAAQW